MTGDGTSPDERAPIRIAIAGTVSDDERDAVVAALTVLALRRRVDDPSATDEPGRWLRTARREGIRAERPEWGRRLER